VGLPSKGKYQKFPSGVWSGCQACLTPEGPSFRSFLGSASWCDPGWRAGFIRECFAPVPPDAAVMAPGFGALFERSTQ